MKGLKKNIFNLSKAILNIPFLRKNDPRINEKGLLSTKCNEYKIFYPPGHFYSPIPSKEELTKKEEEIFNRIPINIPGVNLNEKKQLI